MAHRPLFTAAQLGQYFDRICLPHDERLYSAPPHYDDQLHYIATLVKHQLLTIPFENLTLHYSWHRVVNVQAHNVFRKIVGPPSHGRGGYCMEANTLFHTVLLSLGFHVHIAGARIYDAAAQRYGGFTHCVNIVTTAAGHRYMVDVAYGANGPTAPVPLVEGREQAQIEPARLRLVHEPIPQQVDQGCKVWIYQVRVGPEAGWTPMYCFLDVEFLPEDIQGMNLSPSKSETSFFPRKVLVTRFTTDAERIDQVGDGPQRDAGTMGGQIDGAIILWENTLRWRRGGETKLSITLESENQRLDVLRRYFGISFDEPDREAIKGTVSEIVGNGVGPSGV
ncbi:hypothetical protein F4810DRAFT_713813 [Camillea tinctor]|nr:hypothetical protein F4810DRAFT_713813 [Camillea tinctor]